MAFKDIRRSRKWLSPEEIRILVFLGLLLAALLALNIYLARTLPGGEWLLMRWNGVRSVLGLQADVSLGQKGWRLMPDGEAVILEEQPEIYGGDIARRVQQIVYGRDAFASEYRYILSDPFYIVLFYTPLVLVPELVNGLVPGTSAGFALARGIWMLVAELLLFISVLFSYRLLEWNPPRALNILLIGIGLFSFFSLNALITTSPAIYINFLYLAVLLALRSYTDELAGALLFLAAYQWEVGGLFFLVILIFVLGNRRWGVLAGFGMALFVMGIITFLVNPAWGLPYIRASLSNLYQGVSLNAGTILAGWFPEVPIPLGPVMSLLIIAIVFIESLASINAPFRRLVWTASLALAAMPLAGLAIFPSNQVVLLLPLILVVSLVWERWLRRRVIVVAVLLLVAFLAPFGLYYETILVYSPLYTDLLSVLPPLCMIAALYWMRWWVIHSPRIWADQIGNRT